MNINILRYKIACTLTGTSKISFYLRCYKDMFLLLVKPIHTADFVMTESAKAVKLMKLTNDLRQC